MQRLSVLHFSIFFSLLGVGLVAFFIILPILNLTNLVFYSDDFDSLFNVFNSYYLKLFLVTSKFVMLIKIQVQVSLKT